MSGKLSISTAENPQFRPPNDTKPSRIRPEFGKIQLPHKPNSNKPSELRPTLSGRYKTPKSGGRRKTRQNRNKNRKSQRK